MKIKWLTDDLKRTYNNNIGKRYKIEPKMVQHITNVNGVWWIATESCCEGHEPGYVGYVYYTIREERVEEFESVLVQIVDEMPDDVWVDKQLEYRGGEMSIHYIVHIRQSTIDKYDERFMQLASQV